MAILSSLLLIICRHFTDDRNIKNVLGELSWLASIQALVAKKEK